jgi:hypothetical protein
MQFSGMRTSNIFNSNFKLKISIILELPQINQSKKIPTNSKESIQRLSLKIKSIPSLATTKSSPEIKYLKHICRLVQFN